MLELGKIRDSIKAHMNIWPAKMTARQLPETFSAVTPVRNTRGLS